MLSLTENHLLPAAKSASGLQPDEYGKRSTILPGRFHIKKTAKFSQDEIPNFNGLSLKRSFTCFLYDDLNYYILTGDEVSWLSENRKV